MATTSNFKTYERGTRYQTTQAMFTSGMYYTDTTVPEGAAKVIVNYDVGSDGFSLKPRRGLQTHQIAYSDNDLEMTHYKTEVIRSKTCYQNGKEFLQLITKTRTAEDGTWVISVITVDMVSFKHDKATPYTVYKETHTYKKENIDTGFKPRGVFKEASGTYTIHNMPCTNTVKHAGCFVNDQYFFFNQDTSTLLYTKFDAKKELYEMHELPAQQTTQAQAQQMGFNMLLENPYTYEDVLVEGAASDTISFNAINAFEDAACTIPAQQELIENQEYYYRVAYSGTGTLRLVFEWTASEQINWQQLSEETFTIDKTLPKIVVPFSSPVDKAIIRCTAFRDDEPVDIIWFSFDYQKQYSKAVKNNVNFNLATGTTMTYWQNRLVIAGVQEDKAYLFTSAPELFEYFPFPNNADYLDEPIIAIHTLLDDLLVFTKSKLYLYTLDPVTGLTRKCIQNNLNIKEEEAHLIQVVKNMAYFKSGNYYYMIVPKLNSASGELTVAPIYRNIKGLLDNFEEAVYDILLDTYGITERYPLNTVYNYLDYESVHNVYELNIKEGLYINFDLLYNTVKRTWSVYVYESHAPVHIYKPDVTKAGSMLSLTHIAKITNAPSGFSYKVYKPLIQLLEWGQDCVDKQLPALVTDVPGASYNVAYNNKQHIDTGFIDLNSNYKKRFREIQFRILNDSEEALNFSTTFFIDGCTHTPSFIYTPVIDAETGVLTLNKELTSVASSSASIQGHTKLGGWQLSKDSFPGTNLVKIRVPVSGKGYNSQIKINCSNQKDYTLLDITNVYRQLYSR